MKALSTDAWACRMMRASQDYRVVLWQTDRHRKLHVLGCEHIRGRAVERCIASRARDICSDCASRWRLSQERRADPAGGE